MPEQDATYVLLIGSVTMLALLMLTIILVFFC